MSVMETSREKLLWIFFLVNFVCISCQNDAVISLPQCISNEECLDTLACIDLKCQDPCPGRCFGNATCEIHDHVPYCACKPGFSGSPFTGCHQPARQGESCPLGRPSGRKYYKVERFIKVNFFAGFVHCLTHGGRLATIESKEDNELIKEQIRRSNIRNDQFWTSGTNYPVGQWVWLSSGHPLPEYTDWEPGEPNNSGDEHCLEFYEKNNNGYMWNDNNCMEKVYPICEYFV